MSIKLMSEVWELDLTHAEQSVLMALADHADDKGICFPSVGLLAWKTGYSTRQVKRVLAGLRSTRLVEQVEKGYRTRDGRYRASTYRLHLEAAERKSPYGNRGDDLTPLGDDRGDTEGTAGVTFTTSGVTNEAAGVTPMSPQPSENHHKNRHLQPPRKNEDVEEVDLSVKNKGGSKGSEDVLSQPSPLVALRKAVADSGLVGAAHD